MKVTTWIHPEPVEVDVEVSIEDITLALQEAPDTPRAAYAMLNRAARSMKATTDEIIAAMEPNQREVVANFLTEQAARFRCENTKIAHGSEPLGASAVRPDPSQR